MVLLVGLTAGAQAAAIFSTVRTVSRIIIQLLASVSVVVAPEFAKAYAQDDVGLMRRIHHRGCHAAVWLVAPILLFLVVFGEQLIDIWTGGTIAANGSLLYLFLASAGIDSLWYTSVAVLFSTNRHRSISLIFVIASVLSLPVAYVLLKAWGLDGAALALLLLEVFMLLAVLRQSLPAAGDDLRSWLEAIARPPTLTGLRRT
jgi:O-antigen/teichoic acid export membrane protein